MEASIGIADNARNAARAGGQHYSPCAPVRSLIELGRRIRDIEMQLEAVVQYKFVGRAIPAIDVLVVGHSRI